MPTCTSSLPKPKLPISPYLTSYSRVQLGRMLQILLQMIIINIL